MNFDCCDQSSIDKSAKQTCNEFNTIPNATTQADSPSNSEMKVELDLSGGRETEFLCPHCDVSHLRVGRVSESQVCFCTNCRGFVIDRASLGDLVETLREWYEGPDDVPKPIDPSELHEACHCPACLDVMETFSYYGPGNVVLDTCESCNLTWFNEGELGKIVRAPGQRDYHRSANFESSVLRERLYQKAQEDFAVGLWILGQSF